MGRVIHSAAVAAFFFGAACVPREHIPNRRAIEPSGVYEQALQKTTRQGEFNAHFDEHTQVTATWVTPGFRKIFEDELRLVYGEPPAASHLPAAGTLFIVAVSGADRALGRLAPPESPWTLAFTPAGGTPVAPVRVIGLDRDPLFIRYFFPYWSPWKNLYQVEFPADASATAGTLTLRSVAGRMDLAW